MFNIPEFNLYLIRHGESETNAQPDKMGQTSYDPLSDLGIKQAYNLGSYFDNMAKKWDYVFSSTYNRALDTAIFATNWSKSNIISSYDLREYDPGDWLGVSRSKTVNAEVRSKMGNLNHNFLPPNGESLAQVQRRASAWLDENVLYNKEVYNKFLLEERPLEIAVFSHGLTIKTLLHYVMGFDKAFTWKIVIDNTSVSKLAFGKDGWRVHSINDCSHLV